MFLPPSYSSFLLNGRNVFCFEPEPGGVADATKSILIIRTFQGGSINTVDHLGTLQGRN